MMDGGAVKYAGLLKSVQTYRISNLKFYIYIYTHTLIYIYKILNISFNPIIQ